MIRIFYLFILCTLFSCDIINPEEDIPSFIEFGDFSLLSTPNTGSSSENIKEGWIYINNELIGAFSAGKPFPVLYEGTVDIIVDPGIHENGISFTPSLYPYYNRYRTTVELVAGETTIINPEFEYKENVTFKFIQNFENTTIFTADIDGNEKTTISFTNDGALEGASAKIELDQENPLFNVATNMAFDLPTFGQNAAYLEISFKTDVQIALGVINSTADGVIQQLYRHGLNTTPEWKKVYINLKDILANNPNPPYQVGFAASLPLDQSTGTIFIDNVKLLHFTE